ncbi:MAG: phosphoribosylformimino-5-aminoimidazole carboxamide ribotide isomerase [Desulfotalea sp.]
MKFRPCIDLHDGKVKQIVGSSLSDSNPSELKTNFEADNPPNWFADMYRRDNLHGGHIIKLGSGNDVAAKKALAAWPSGMQIGGGINNSNAKEWLDAGASHLIVTSWVFRDGLVDYERLNELVAIAGKDKIVLDLSCRRRNNDYFIVTDRWQNFTEVKITEEVLANLSSFCDEFLIHAADVEGKCQGIELELLKILSQYTPIPTTYAGGIRNLDDMELIDKIGNGKIDATIGSALDIFGGDSITYSDAVRLYGKQ